MVGMCRGGPAGVRQRSLPCGTIIVRPGPRAYPAGGVRGLGASVRSCRGFRRRRMLSALRLSSRQASKLRENRRAGVGGCPPGRQGTGLHVCAPRKSGARTGGSVLARAGSASLAVPVGSSGALPAGGGELQELAAGSYLRTASQPSAARSQQTARGVVTGSEHEKKRALGSVTARPPAGAPQPRQHPAPRAAPAKRTQGRGLRAAGRGGSA